MKNITKLVLVTSLLFFSCEVEKISEQESIEAVAGKAKKNKTKGPEILKECLVINADRCGYSDYAASSFWWPKEGEGGPEGLFSVSDEYQMTYTEYDDGTINIKGDTELNGCVANIDLWLKDKKNLEEWNAGGGLFKDEIEFLSCSEVIAELLNYYIVDELRSSMTASGCGERDGAYTITHRPADQLYAFQVGPGGALFDVGDDFGVSGWAFAIHNETGKSHILDFNFTTKCETGAGCETAFARGNDGQTCFIGNGFNRWGWTIGPLAEGDYTYEVYAGAGQCDTNKGELVGTVDVSYANGEVDVVYNIDAAYDVEETHTYAGTEMFPTDKKGKLTVAPGQYSIADDLSGEIYVIAHAVVCQD
ncbi:hypothetical protein FK220_019565 [Flavobacteriaceae bacterium TP-CH-4]|uniref:Uncharacterized protein n=1 Tax=Pelagihabitans pacificus TaxID=2696054 RepID=A0A967E8D5_9FLAO|nr:hypothetical protein [Pelagihabitans pacificus]NHF61560.1 hypothetical protein [Pelagihabitans pacificus]